MLVTRGEQIQMRADDMALLRCCVGAEAVLGSINESTEMEGSLEEAFDMMSRQSVMSAEQINEMHGATTKARKRFADMIGKTTGTELVRVRKVSDHVAQVFFSELASVSPIYWSLTYYRQPAGKWVLTHANWNLELSQIIR